MQINTNRGDKLENLRTITTPTQTKLSPTNVAKSNISSHKGSSTTHRKQTEYCVSCMDFYPNSILLQELVGLVFLFWLCWVLFFLFDVPQPQVYFSLQCWRRYTIAVSNFASPEGRQEGIHMSKDPLQTELPHSLCPVFC